MTRGSNLYQLQQLDTERDRKQQRLREVNAALGADQEVRQARRRLERAQGRVREISTRQQDLELELQSLSEKSARSEDRLYGGSVRNPKELSDLQAEIASLKRRRRELEDQILEAMIEREDAEAAQEKAQAALDRTQAQWDADQSDLRAEQAELERRLQEIAEAREALLPAIDPGDLAMYEALRKQKGGTAVVEVKDNACGGCGLTISPNLEWQLRQEKLIQCGNCGRMIVRTP